MSDSTNDGACTPEGYSVVHKVIEGWCGSISRFVWVKETEDGEKVVSKAMFKTREQAVAGAWEHYRGEETAESVFSNIYFTVKSPNGAYYWGTDKTYSEGRWNTREEAEMAARKDYEERCKRQQDFRNFVSLVKTEASIYGWREWEQLERDLDDNLIHNFNICGRDFFILIYLQDNDKGFEIRFCENEKDEEIFSMESKSLPDLLSRCSKVVGAYTEFLKTLVQCEEDEKLERCREKLLKDGWAFDEGFSFDKRFLKPDTSGIDSNFGTATLYFNVAGEGGVETFVGTYDKDFRRAFASLEEAMEYIEKVEDVFARLMEL